MLNTTKCQRLSISFYYFVNYLIICMLKRVVLNIAYIIVSIQKTRRSFEMYGYFLGIYRPTLDLKSSSQTFWPVTL